jgi:hypothetical protein
LSLYVAGWLQAQINAVVENDVPAPAATKRLHKNHLQPIGLEPEAR